MKKSLLPSLVLALLLGACQSNPSQPEKPAPAPAPTPAPAAKPAAPAAKPAEAPAPAKAAENPAAAKQAEARLAGGVQLYEDGNYKGAQAELQAALDGGLAAKADQARANKYLAFIACSTGQRDQCKKYFLNALALYPRFRLTKAEAGHPIWGPVYGEARAEAAKKAPAPKK
ncbi:MAG TPA: TssQ family T6SS-associated lipoprotein [Rhodocyclaceae bacterium]|nr:TssQ family T6SS-associated lipoprotein [Rhodocyclaceae bacterium]